jgi:hypothetical protein
MALTLNQRLFNAFTAAASALKLAAQDCPDLKSRGPLC